MTTAPPRAPKRNFSAPDVRALNRAAILELIRAQSPLSRTEISQTLNLSMPTVMRVVDGLLAEKLVMETGDSESSGGRRRSLLTFNGESRLCIGVDLGGTMIFGAVSDLNGKLLYSKGITHFMMEPEATFQFICSFISDLLRFANSTNLPILVLGIGVPGIVEPATGNVRVRSRQGWSEFPLRSRLAEHFDLPMLIERDVHLAALGELSIRPPTVDNLVFLKVNYQVEAGIVIHRGLYYGSQAQAGEIGFTLPDRADAGRLNVEFGALESSLSEIAIVRRAIELLRQQKSDWQLDQLTAEDVFQAAEQGEGWALQVVTETVETLTQTVAFIGQLLNPDVIVLGGLIAKYGDLLLLPLQERLKRSIPNVPRIACTTLQQNAVIFGSIFQLLQRNTPSAR